MDLVQLKYFIRVSELKSFTKAASSLHIAQPAITRQVRQLEDELGVQLLFRHSRGAEPTDAGMQLKDGAEAIFRLLDQTRADVQASNSVVSGRLRIGFPPSLGDLLIGAAVGGFRQKYPQVILSLQEGYSQALRDGLLADKLDLALLTGHEENPLLVTTHLFDEALWIIDPPDSKPRRASKQEQVFKLSDVAARDLVQPSRANTLRRLVEDKMAEAGLQVRVVVEAESLRLIKDLVKRGVGSHVSPFSAVSQEVEAGELSGGPLRDVHISRFLAHRVDRPLSLALTRFTEILMAELVGIQRNTKGAIKLRGSSR